ncbi:MAG: hypothetical protein JXB30_17915 [Anaerolineae bacterium]|nr:hypothetical protein [Anaerolineae bacterium]
MAKPRWVRYRADDTTRNRVRRILVGIRIDFGGSKPEIEDALCILPREGSVCLINENRFVFKYTEHVQEFERGYWVGSGEPGYGQEWVSSSEMRYRDDDDRFFAGPERFVPAGYRHRAKYFYAGKEHGVLFLKRVDDDLARVLENDLDSFVARVLG